MVARQFGCASGVLGTEEESARNDLTAGEVGGFSGNIGHSPRDLAIIQSKDNNSNHIWYPDNLTNS